MPLVARAELRPARALHWPALLASAHSRPPHLAIRVPRSLVIALLGGSLGQRMEAAEADQGGSFLPYLGAFVRLGQGGNIRNREGRKHRPVREETSALTLPPLPTQSCTLPRLTQRLLRPSPRQVPRLSLRQLATPLPTPSLSPYLCLSLSHCHSSYRATYPAPAAS